jgi:ABC-type glycerol-3-phosphate transport system permease component
MTTQAYEVVRPVPTTISGRILRPLSSTPVHIALILLALIWLVPSVGLLITSFRPRPDIGSSGWWETLSSFNFTLDTTRTCSTTRTWPRASATAS